MFLMLLVALVSISAVSAGENATDLASADVVDDVVSVDDGASDVKLNSTVSASPTTGYEKFSTKFTVTLTSNGTKMASKPIVINVGGTNYTRTTDNQGQAVLNIKLAKGTYLASYYFLGDSNTNPSNGTAKITVNYPTKTTINVYDKNVNYRQGLKSIFTARLLTSTGKAVKGQTVIFKYDGITRTAKTDSAGRASIYVSLKKGTHKICFAFKANSPYLSSASSHKVNVKEAMPKGYGYFVWGDMMKSVNLKALKDKATKHIFLNDFAFKMYGSSAVKSWISDANRYGMKVHIWVNAFYDGKWISPVNNDGSFKYSYMSKKIREAKSYAKISGVSGIYLDYLRFPGTAYRYDTSTDAINYFVKKLCGEVRKVSPNCIISASAMPEPGMLEYYYGQDISTISKYLDVIAPLAYKGNYGKTTTWINYVTNSFVLQSNGAQVWTGIQAYVSDSNPTKLSISYLLKDAKSAKTGGAKGVVLFRWGLSNLLDFRKV